jgi:hypothetical protein
VARIKVIMESEVYALMKLAKWLPKIDCDDAPQHHIDNSNYLSIDNCAEINAILDAWEHEHLQKKDEIDGI